MSSLISYIPVVGRWWSGDASQSPASAFDQLETMDIVLFHGRHYWFSYIVEWVTWSEWSHVGVVVRDPTFTDKPLKGLYLWESGVEPTPDAETGKPKWGVQFTPLEDMVAKYDGTVVFRKLTIPNKHEWHSRLSDGLRRAHDMSKSATYDTHMVDLLATEFAPLANRVGQQTSRFFCSALTAFIYSCAGLLPKSTRWDAFSPNSWSSANKTLVLEHGALLGPETPLK